MAIEEMTAEQIRKLSDDALNDLAAKVVMGWDVEPVESPFTNRRYTKPGPLPNSLGAGDAIDWQFSSDDSAAFALVDAMMKRGWTPNLCGVLADNGEQSWYCRMEFMTRSAAGSKGWYVAEEAAVGHINRCRAIAEACVLAALATEEKK